MSDVASAAPAASTPAPAATPAAPAAKTAAPSTNPVGGTTKNVGGHQQPASPNVPNSKHAETPPVDAAGESPAQAAERKARKLQLKVYGQSEEYDLDNTPDEKIARDLQMGRAAQRALQEKAEIEKQHRAFIEAVKKDPLNALKDPNIGIDVRKLVEDQLVAEYERQQKLSGLPPEAREAYERAERAEQEAAKLREERAAFQREQQQRHIAEVTAKEQQRLEQDFISALETGGLPKNRQTVAMMAEIAAFNLQHGIELTPQQIAAEVREKLGGMTKHVMAGLKGESLVKYLGDDVVREVIRYSVSKVKQPSQASAKTFEPPPPAAPAERKPRSRMKSDDEGPDYSPRDPRELRKFFRGR